MYTSRRCWFQPAKTPADGPSSRREARQAGASSTRLIRASCSSRMLSRVACSTCTDHDVHHDHRACGRPTFGYRPAKTSVPCSIGPTAPPSDTPNDTNMADDTRRRVRSMIMCLQVSSPVTSTPRVLNGRFYHPRGTRGISSSHVLDRRRHLL